MSTTFVAVVLLPISTWLSILSVPTSCGGASSDTNKNLTFMFITSFGRFGFNSSGTFPALDIALDMINNRSDLLQGYNLVYDGIVRDSECNSQSSLDRFFEGIGESQPTKIGVIGCGCSVATEPVASIIHHWNIPLISYGTTSATLSNTKVYRNFFRANPPSTALTPALRALMKQFNWKRVGVLTQDENRFRKVESSIRNELASVGIQAESQSYMTHEDPGNIEDIYLQSKDFRVFLLNSYPNPRIICAASKLGFLYPKYTWITYGWYAQASWTDDDVVNCTEGELKAVLDEGISVEVYPYPEDVNAETLAGLTPAEFQRDYQRRASIYRYEILDTTAAQLFDDIWGLALALNATISMIDSNDFGESGCENYPGEFVPLEEFKYNNTRMGCLITWNLRRTNFSGVSGRVYFNESLIDHTVTLLQYQLNGNNLTRRPFATVDKATNFSFIYDSGFNDDNLYPDGIPLDGAPITEVHSIVLPIVVTVDILAFLGISFAVFCFLFNVIFREQKVIKLTSPTVNYFIIVGTVIMYCSVYFYVIPSNGRAIAHASCHIREWLFTIGYTLSYGALLAKLWRVYTIFHNPSPKKRIYKDWQLMVLILIIVAIAALLLFFGSAIPPLRGDITETRDPEFGLGLSTTAQETYLPIFRLDAPILLKMRIFTLRRIGAFNRNEQDVMIEYHVLVCYKEAGSALYWRIFVFAYLAVLQILGIMLAFQTRRVKVKSLRDSTFVTANVYISSIVIVIFILVTFALRVYTNAYSAIFSTGILVLTTSFLALTFVPKMILVYKDPTGESIKSSTHQSHNSISVLKTDTIVDLEGKIASLEGKLKEKDETIDKMKLEIEATRKITSKVIE